MHTEKQASELWCPMVRSLYDGISGDNTYVRANGFAERNPHYSRCIASQCAMWRWHPDRPMLKCIVTELLARCPTIELAGTATYNERKNMYPNDEQFEETTVAKVSDEGNGWSIQRADGWSFYVPAPSSVVPAEGMTARFYGKGIGFTVRGLFLDGQKVFYRTEAEDKEKHEIDTYGADAADWLKRWDAGNSVWSIEMGGLGPGYEQCIHITAAEILRHLLERKYEPATWGDREAWERDRKEIEAAGFANARISALGLSGAQWGAALNLALQFYRRGPRAVMTDERVKDRHIQVQRTFPVPAAATIKEALEKMDDDAVDEFYSDVEGNGDLIPDPTKPMEHVSRADCWCQPDTNYVDPDTGATVYVHREIQ